MTESGALLIERKKKKSGDLPLLFSVILLSLLGLAFVYSASKYSAKTTYGDEFYFVKKHLIGLLLGYAAMIFGMFFDYRKYKKIALAALLVVFVLLGLVFTPIGYSNYGATRWIRLFGITVQPSETAKICFVIFAASYFSSSPQRAKSFVGCLPVLGAGGAICVLIILEPNMSITVCFGLLTLAVLFFAGMKTSHFVVLLVPAALAVPLLIIAEPYRLNRLSAFLNPWASPKGEGYQLLQSLYALGSGGWFGVGFLQSRQKLRFLPFSESDFILAVIGEETGFTGLVILFAIILFVIVRGIKIAVNAKDYFGYLLASGIMSVYAIQTLVNALVVTGSIPPTGLPLPLISAGNTSLIVFLFSFGIVYNISEN